MKVFSPRHPITPQRAAFNTLAKRYPHWFQIDYCKPVRHNFLPFGQQATLFYDASYPLLQRLVSYEQSRYELTGKTPDYCYKELNLPQTDEEYLRDLRCAYILDQQTDKLEQISHGPLDPLEAYAWDSNTPQPRTLATPFQAMVMQASVPSPSSTDVPEDIKKQTPLEHVNNIPDNHLPGDPTKDQEIRDLLLQHSTALSLYKFDVGYVDPAIYGYARIDTGDATPFFEPPRRFSHLERQALHARVKEYRHSHILSDSTSSWASNPVMIPKKDTDRTVDDYK